MFSLVRATGQCFEGAIIAEACAPQTQARGELPADDVAVALKLVLSMEGIPC